MFIRSANSWVNWIIVGGLVTLAGLLLVVFPGLILLAAMFERLRLRRLIPYEPGRPLTGKPASVGDEAVRAGGFVRVGTFTDGDKGIKMGLVSLYLSPDRRTLLWAQHRGGARAKLISRLTDGRWLVSSTLFGVADLSGFVDEEMVRDATFALLFNHHCHRLVAVYERVAPFDPDAILDDLLAHDRRRVERMVETGMARYRSGEKDSWSYSPRGAMTVVMGHFRNMSRAANS